MSIESASSQRIGEVNVAAVFGPPKMDMKPVKRVVKKTGPDRITRHEVVIEDDGSEKKGTKPTEQESHPVRGVTKVGWRSDFPDPNDADRGRDD